MKLSTSIVTGAALLAIGVGAPVVQATASPSSPTTPTPAAAVASAATASTAATKAVRARIIWFYTAITDVQRRCLADADLQRPAGKLTDAQRKALQAQIRAALTKCDVTLPGRFADRSRFGFGWASLTSVQQHCLADTALTRPVGRLTTAERAAVRMSKLDAATTCGIGS